MADAKYYATGKRKTAIARVWIKPGSGIITVNEQDPEAYFGDAMVRKNLEKPFMLTDTAAKFDVVATMKGGGKSAQSDAVRHGIAKALLEINPEYRVTLKKAGLLTRDPRAKERKKYGQRAARARFQFSKR